MNFQIPSDVIDSKFKTHIRYIFQRNRSTLSCYALQNKYTNKSHRIKYDHNIIKTNNNQHTISASLGYIQYKCTYVPDPRHQPQSPGHDVGRLT